MAYVRPGREPEIFTGTLEGRISTEPAGIHGFGYDPVFIPSGHDQTVALLGADIKNQISHRAAALSAFFTWLKVSKDA
jgi:XTP/dITP diphosphohydrolase